MAITIYYSPERLTSRQAHVEKWLDEAKSAVSRAGYFHTFKQGKEMSSRWTIVGALTAEEVQEIVDVLLLAFDLAGDTQRS